MSEVGHFRRQFRHIGQLRPENELGVSAARSRRGSSVGRMRDVGGEWSTMEISLGTLGGAGGDHRLASAV